MFEDPYYSAGGICEEAGEYIGQVKHEIKHGWPEDREYKLKELGDILWYLTAAAKTQGFTLEEVAQANLDKLKDRYPDGFTQEASINRKENTEGGNQ